MAELNWNELKGKKIHIILRNNFEYNAEVLAVDDSSKGLVFFKIKDKFGKEIILTTGEIKFIEVKE